MEYIIHDIYKEPLSLVDINDSLIMVSKNEDND